MQDEEDFYRVKGRLPKRDKNGNEITLDSLGSGGARRDDGTLSAMVTDLEVQGDGDGPGIERHDELANHGEASLRRSLIDQHVVPAAVQAAEVLFDWLVHDVVLPAAKMVVSDLRSRLFDRDLPTATDKVSANGMPPPRIPGDGGYRRPSVVPAQSDAETDEVPDGLEATPEPALIGMSSSEWQELLRVWSAVAVLEEAIRGVLANARIEDDDDGVQSALSKPTPEERAAFAHSLLGSTLPSVEDATYDRLIRLLGESRLVESQHALSRQLKVVEEPPQLTEGEL